MPASKKLNKKPLVKSKSSVAKTTPAAPSLGARSVLGRGLSALIRPAAVQVNAAPVPPSMSHQEPEKPVHLHVIESPRQQESVQPETAKVIEVQVAAQPVVEVVAPSPKTNAQPNSTGLLQLSLDSIVPNKKQPRRHFNEEEIQTLSKSIRETGLLQPILVRPQDHTGEYEIVAGERRYRAAKQAGLTSVPVLVRELNDKETLQIGIIENVQRSDLNPIEEAQAYQRLIEEFAQTQAEVAESVGKDRASITNSLRLLKLAPEIQELLVQKRISAGHGRALLMFEKHQKQVLVSQRILTEGLSVREVERLAQKIATQGKQTVAVSSGSSSAKEKSYALMDIEDRLRRSLGTKVSLSLSQNGEGELRIRFFSKEELNHLLERLGA